MGKLGFFLSMILISVAVTSLIVNIHLQAVNNQLKSELSELRQVEFQTISKGYYSGHRNASYYVIENESEWTIIWNQHQRFFWPKLSPPEINFSNTTVVAVFMGEFPTGGYGIEIKEVINTPEHVIVKVEKTYPGRGCVVSEAFSSPYHIIKMNKVFKQIVFETIEKTVECQ